VNAKLARGIRAGGDDPALVCLPANGEGLSAQGRVALFFNGAKESIKVEVKDRSRHGDCANYSS
jgi:hypothetical protein